MRLASILIGPFVPRISLRLGTVTTIMVGLAGGGICIARCSGSGRGCRALCLLRLVSGFVCMTTAWILSESWLNRLATEHGTRAGHGAVRYDLDVRPGGRSRDRLA